MGRTTRTVALALAATLVASGCNALARVSIPTGNGVMSNATAPSTAPAIAADGAAVAFVSAGRLVPGDTNGVADVFVRDLSTDVTVRASVGAGGAQANGASGEPALSADGRFVAFSSTATNLVPDDTNGVADVYVHDRSSGTTERVSVSGAGGQAAGASTDPAISADGRYVAFTSAAPDLVDGDTNGATDVFVRDRSAGTTVRVSVTAGGAQLAGASSEPAISPSGAWLAFTSTAANVVGGDTNGVADVFLAARTGGTVRRASATDTLTRPFQQANGPSGRPQVTDPVGGYTGGGEPLVAFESQATNLSGDDGNGSQPDVFVNTTVFSLSRTVRISAGPDAGSHPGIGVLDGGPGFLVTYRRSGAPAAVVAVQRENPLSTAGLDPRVVSTANDGSPANGPSGEPSVTPDGRLVAFSSTAGNLAGRSVPSSVGDVYVGRARLTRVAAVEPGRVGLGETRDLVITGSGFEPTSVVQFDRAVQVNSVLYESPSRLVANVTAIEADPEDRLRTVYVRTPGVGFQSAGQSWSACVDCVEIASVVEQPGSVAIRLTSLDLEVGSFPLSLPACEGALCPALTTEVTADGDFVFGLESVELTSIDIPIELFAGVETTLTLIPAFQAPVGRVIPATGTFELDMGIMVKLGNPLLPSSCALGPVRAELRTGPDAPAPAVPYDQETGRGVLAGGFTEELAVTGCGFFTGTLNTALGLPVPIAENSVVLGVELDPRLTGTAVP